MKKEILITIGITFLFLSVGVQPAFAIVNNSSGYIQDLIDIASDGDTIYIPSGIYYENIVIDKSITLVGEDKNTTIIDGGGNGNGIEVITNWVNISGFTIQNSAGEWTGGITIKSNNTRIKNNIIKNNKDFGIYTEKTHHNNITDNSITDNKYGIHLRTTAINNTINNNIIHNNRNHGILLLANYDNIISNNTITNNVGDGIMLSVNTRRCTVRNNNISFNKKGGIWIFDAYKNTISNNSFLNNKGDGINIYGTGNTCENNVISDNSGGIIIMYSFNNKILYNSISDNSPYGVYIDHSESNTVNGNVISNNKGGITLCGIENTISDNTFFKDGLYLTYSQKNKFNNNTVNGKPLLLLISESDKIINKNAGQVILIGCTNVTIRNLDLSNTTVGIELWNSHECLISENTLSNNKRYGLYVKGTNNEICRNNINDNKKGLYWDGKFNIVKENNFKNNNGRNAHFNIKPWGGVTTKWIKNYWDKPGSKPKIISGKKEFYIDIYPPVDFSIKWFGIDWRPAIEPYDIKV